MIKFRLFILKLLGIKFTPFMIPIRDYWICVDTYQRLWKIKYNYNYDCPFEFNLLYKEK